MPTYIYIHIFKYIYVYINIYIYMFTLFYASDGDVGVNAENIVAGQRMQKSTLSNAVAAKRLNKVN